MKQKKDISTEEKIKAAARIVFTQKGFAATRTRDIAEAAGINLALLNYYFRSKENLFQIVMIENIYRLVESVKTIINDPDTSFDEKLDLVVADYIDLLTEEPNLPLFVLSEIQSNPEILLSKLKGDVFLDSVFIKQMNAITRKNKLKKVAPEHFLINLLGLTIFPFVACPMIKPVFHKTEEDFEALMKERKKMIPVWIKRMIGITE